MFAAVMNGVRLWLYNLPLLSALVLTFWLPGNILVDYVAATASDEMPSATELRLLMLLEGILGPIYSAAVIYALVQRRCRRQVGYVEAMRVGFQTWGRLFFTRLLAGLMVVLGLVCFVIPGVILAIRFALLDMPVVLEGGDASRARARSWDLTSGIGFPLLGVCLLFYCMLFAFSALLYLPLEILNESVWMTDLQYYTIDVVISCAVDVFSLMLPAVLFAIYVHASGRGEDEKKQADAPVDFDSPNTSLPPVADDGNPYQPPTQA